LSAGWDEALMIRCEVKSAVLVNVYQAVERNEPTHEINAKVQSEKLMLTV
jgi:hypothetical protein